MLQLQLQAVDAGVVDLWQVRMFPPAGASGVPLAVVVPARDSRAAAAEAMRRNPGYVVGPISKIQSRY